ncbi:hypothetical protein TeGR_g6538, partial [Tetraparma gracilis]
LLLISLISLFAPLVSPDSVTRHPNSSITAHFLISDTHHSLPASPSSDLLQLAASFCTAHSILDDHCALNIYHELSDGLYCGPPGSPHFHPRTFRFLHSPVHYNSDEFDLLRETFVHYTYKECWEGEEVSGLESFVWSLGHFMDTVAGHATLRTLLPPPPHPAPTFNSFMGTKFPGNKDSMFSSLLQFSRLTSQLPPHLLTRTSFPDLPFLPRTFLLTPALFLSNPFPSLTGIYVLKQPAVELGDGIKIISLPADLDKVEGCRTHVPRSVVGADGSVWQDQEEGVCILQKYVDPPLLLPPYVGSGEKKFSFGVYTHVTLDPFTVLIHDALLVLFASYPYDPENTDSELQ